jgi:hypothetical protein
MDDRTDARRLLDLHNINIDSMPPVGVGLCGFTHLERPHLPATAPAPGAIVSCRTSARTLSA